MVETGQVIDSDETSMHSDLEYREYQVEMCRIADVLTGPGNPLDGGEYFRRPNNQRCMEQHQKFLTRRICVFRPGGLCILEVSPPSFDMVRIQVADWVTQLLRQVKVGAQDGWCRSSANERRVTRVRQLMATLKD